MSSGITPQSYSTSATPKAGGITIGLATGNPAFGSWIAEETARKSARNAERVVELTKGLIKKTSEPDKQTGGLKRFFANFVAMSELPIGASTMLFIQDTLAVWAPKMTAVRSTAEAIEATFLEFVESALFYFSAPLLGQHVLSKFMHSILPDNQKINDPAHIKRPEMAVSIKDMNEKINLKKLAEDFHGKLGNTIEGKQAKKLIALKAGTVIATLSVVALECSLSFAKNLLTLNLFKTGDFNEVAHLNDGQPKTREEILATERTNQKSRRRIRQGAAVAAGFLLAGLGFARYASRNKTLFNIARKFLTGFHTRGKGWGPLNGNHWTADFSYSQMFKRVKKPKGKHLPPQYAKEKGKDDTKKLVAKFGLSGAQKYFIIAMGGLSYLDATRNNLEFVETLTRVWGITVPYLTVGSDLISGGIRKLLHGESKLPQWLNWFNPSEKTVAQYRQLHKVEEGSGAWLSVGEITDKAIDSVPGLREKVGPDVGPVEAFKWIHSNDPQLREAGNTFWKLMNVKMKAFSIPLAIGIFGAGMSVAWLNRFWTAYRYKQQRADIFEHRLERVHYGLSPDSPLEETTYPAATNISPVEERLMPQQAALSLPPTPSNNTFQYAAS